jgi:6-phosphofructokinase 2
MQNLFEPIICIRKNLEREYIVKSIITITLNPSVDQSCTTNVVTDEKKLSCNPPQYDPGGGGINVSRAIHLLGGQTKAFYPAGGCTGDILEKLLDEEKLDHVRIDVNSSTRVNFHVIEETTDKQFRFNMPGMAMKKGEFKDLLRDLKDYTPHPDYIVASGSIPPKLDPSCLRKIADLSGELNAKLIVDSSGEALRKALGEGLYLIKPNLREFSELIGKKIKNQDQIIKEAKKIIDQHKVSVVIVSMGQAGTIFVSAEQSGHIQAPFVPINSRIGAGDSMLAGLTLHLSENESLKDAVIFGVAAGTAAVITPGTELCRKEDVERLYMKIR